MDEDIYFHKTVDFHAGKINLRFRTSQALFSSHNVDIGTRFLLRSIIESDYKPGRILDMGCGYGPLGLTLKKLYPDSHVEMVDRDALAIAYSRQNAELNGLAGVEICGSLGYDDVQRTDFDLITCKYTGKGRGGGNRLFTAGGALLFNARWDGGHRGGSRVRIHGGENNTGHSRM